MKEQPKNLCRKFISYVTGNEEFGSNRSTRNNGTQFSKSHLSLSSYLHWMFRADFCVLFGLSCLLFFLFTIFFAGAIYLSGLLEPQCLRINGDEFKPNFAGFFDAFTLSWTTFSTVGYGSAYPALGNENDSKVNCMHLTIICSLEAFMGILYTGFCGAMLFGKVLRLQSQANVKFNDKIFIRYGLEVDSNSIYETSERDKKCIECPVLEFCLKNNRREIIDAKLNVVASIDACESKPHNHLSDNQDKTLPKSGVTISKLALEFGDHPIFENDWLARHTLNENSPILTLCARNAIQKCGGYWPENMNNIEDIKKSLKFNQILVSLSGVFNLSAFDVYAQKIYKKNNDVSYELMKQYKKDEEEE
jgi:hypothetical protein